MTKDIFQALLFGPASLVIPKDVIRYGSDVASLITGNPVFAAFGNAEAGFDSGKGVGDSFKLAALEGGASAAGSFAGPALGAGINDITGAAAGSVGSALGSAAGTAAADLGVHEIAPVAAKALGLGPQAPDAPSATPTPSGITPFAAPGGAASAGPPGGAQISASTAPGIYPWTRGAEGLPQGENI